jgi:hypothetical protein
MSAVASKVRKAPSNFPKTSNDTQAFSRHNPSMFETHWLTLSILELVRASRYDEIYSSRRPLMTTRLTKVTIRQ